MSSYLPSDRMSMCVFVWSSPHKSFPSDQTNAAVFSAEDSLSYWHLRGIVAHIRELRTFRPAVGLKPTPARQQWRKPRLCSIVMDNVFHPPHGRASVTPSAFRLLRAFMLLGQSTSGVHPGRPHLQLHQPPAFTFLYLPSCTLLYFPSRASSSFNPYTHTHLQKGHLLDSVMSLQSHLWIHNFPCRIPPSAFFPLHSSLRAH